MARRVRLEKVDRGKLKDCLIAAGCKYVRINFGGPFTGKTGRPDIEGIALDGVYFAIEMKREDRLPWDACTDKQKAELMRIQMAGGRGAAVRLNEGLTLYKDSVRKVITKNVEAWVPCVDHRTSCDIPGMLFVNRILTGKDWPLWKSPS